MIFFNIKILTQNLKANIYLSTKQREMAKHITAKNGDDTKFGIMVFKGRYVSYTKPNMIRWLSRELPYLPEEVWGHILSFIIYQRQKRTDAVCFSGIDTVVVRARHEWSNASYRFDTYPASTFTDIMRESNRYFHDIYRNSSALDDIVKRTYGSKYADDHVLRLMCDGVIPFDAIWDGTYVEKKNFSKQIEIELRKKQVN